MVPNFYNLSIGAVADAVALWMAGALRMEVKLGIGVRGVAVSLGLALGRPLGRALGRAYIRALGRALAKSFPVDH